VINGTTPGRNDDAEVTIFDSTGIALQDLIVSAAVLKAAEAAGIGTVCDLA